MKVNEDKNEGKYDCEDKEDGKRKNFICDFEGCSQSYKRKKDYAFDFKCHFIGELTCKQCGMAFKFQHVLRSHLLIHENKRLFKCLHKGCGKTFNTKNDLRSHQVVHLNNKQFK